MNFPNLADFDPQLRKKNLRLPLIYPKPLMPTVVRNWSLGAFLPETKDKGVIMQNTNQVTWHPNQGWDSRIHIAANGELVNVFVVVTERYVVIVDTLINAITAKALADYAQPYLSGRQLLVVNSHADWDHAWGNQLFAGPNASHPAPIIAHVKCGAALPRPRLPRHSATDAE